MFLCGYCIWFYHLYFTFLGHLGKELSEHLSSLRVCCWFSASYINMCFTVTNFIKWEIKHCSIIPLVDLVKIQHGHQSQLCNFDWLNLKALLFKNNSVVWNLTWCKWFWQGWQFLAKCVPVIFVLIRNPILPLNRDLA